MKTCPQCQKDFSRRENGGGCPHCHVQLCIINGIVRLKEDKETVDEIITVFHNHLDRISGTVNTFEVSETSRERQFAYRLVERTKKYFSNQRVAPPVTVREFLTGFMKYVLSIPWYSQHLKTLIQLENKLPELVREYWAKVVNQAAKIQAQTRVISQLPGGLELSYGI